MAKPQHMKENSRPADVSHGFQLFILIGSNIYFNVILASPPSILSEIGHFHWARTKSCMGAKEDKQPALETPDLRRRAGAQMPPGSGWPGAMPQKRPGLVKKNAPTSKNSG